MTICWIFKGGMLEGKGDGEFMFVMDTTNE